MPVRAPILAVSTWSVHRALGISYPDAPGDDAPGQGRADLGAGIAVADGAARRNPKSRDRPGRDLLVPHPGPRPGLRRRASRARSPTPA